MKARSKELFDRAIAANRKAIDLLQEFRTRLISNVVTGKLDVREAAAKLPKESEEPETLEETLETEAEETQGEAEGVDELVGTRHAVPQQTEGILDEEA